MPPFIPCHLPSRWSFFLLLSAPATIIMKVNSSLIFKLSAAIGWVPAIPWPWSLFRHQVKETGWEDRASRCTSEVPTCAAGCPRLRDCRVGGRSTTPWWSVPETSGRHGRRRRRTPTGSPLHTCPQWRQRQKHVLRLDLWRVGTGVAFTYWVESPLVLCQNLFPNQWHPLHLALKCPSRN